MRNESERGTATLFLTYSDGETDTREMRNTTYRDALNRATHAARESEVVGVDVDFVAVLQVKPSSVLNPLVRAQMTMD